ncbi:retrovirus-related pol polyprotein from transposon TNT 1-94 [Tanacetum coccineum]
MVNLISCQGDSSKLNLPDHRHTVASLKKSNEHQTSTPRTPEQNGVVERQNLTLVEDARTMLSDYKLPLFFWAEAIATACYTQNRSIIIPTHKKTAYHIINDRKPSIKHLYIFGCTCYLTRDCENLDKMKEKGAILSETSIANDTSCLIPQRHKASYYDSSGPVPQLQNISPTADTTVSSQQELDLLFGPLYDEFFNEGTSSVNKSSSPTDNSKQQDTPPTMSIQSSTEPTTPTNVNVEENNDNQAVDTQVQQDEFINPFCTPVREIDESSSRNIDNSNMHTFYQPHDSEYRWTKDHPLEQVHGNPSKPVQTRGQLATDPKMCMFALTVSIVEPKTIKEAMADSAWIEAMQEELHQFDRLQVCELIDKPFGKNVIKLKWLWKNKKDEDQTIGFRFDPDHPDKVYRLRKALYGLKQAPRAWYDELSNFLMSKGFTKGLQIHQSPKGIFINQAKYALEILKKHNMDNCHSIGTPLATKPKLDVDLSGEPVDQSDYRSKIGSLMYLTSSRPDLVQAVCYCARYQARPTQKHLKEVKRIFKYLKGTINMGLWYPKDSGFELTAFSDADHAGCLDTRKSTSGGIQFLGDKLVSWMSKKQNCTAMSSAEAEYVALSASCAQVMWMRTQLQDYGFNYNKIPLYCDSQSAIAISCNPVQHSRTKHIHTRYHFIKEQVENGIIELYFVRTEYQLADMFTKALPEDRFKYLVRRIGMRCLTPAELEVLTNETA